MKKIILPSVLLALFFTTGCSKDVKLPLVKNNSAAVTKTKNQPPQTQQNYDQNTGGHSCGNHSGSYTGGYAGGYPGGH